MTSHPTADELYQRVKAQLPRISLATVYRNLEVLSQEGVIQKLETGGRQKRFDGEPKNHCHIRCVRCGRVDDVRTEGLEGLEAVHVDAGGYRVLNHRLEFDGVCPGCQAREGRTGRETGAEKGFVRPE